MNDIELKRKRVELAVKGVGLLGICLVLGPLYLTILHGIGALAALVVGAAGVFTAVKFLPWFALKIGNWSLKAFKAEAAKNPVESLQQQYIKKDQALKDFKENIRIFSGQVLTFADQVKQYVKDGLEDADTYKEQLAKMKQLLEHRQGLYLDAQQMLADFAETIERTDRKWKMACAAAKMNEAAGEMAGDVFDKICIETALDSVQNKLNQSFADLEIALLDDDKSKKSLLEKRKAASIQPMISGEPPKSANRQPIAVS